MDAVDVRERLVASLPDPPGPDWASIERALAVEEDAVGSVGRASAPSVLQQPAAAAMDDDLADLDADGDDGDLRVARRAVRRPRLRLVVQGLAIVAVLAVATFAVVSTRPSEKSRRSALALAPPAPGGLPGTLLFSDAGCRLQAYSFATGTTVAPSVTARTRICLIDAASPNGRFLAFRPAVNQTASVLDLDGGAVLDSVPDEAPTALAWRLPAVADDGEVASCTFDGLRIAAFGRSTRHVAGCFVAAAGGTLVVLDTGAIRDVENGRTIVPTNPRLAGADGVAGSRDGLFAILGAGRNGVDVYGLDGRRRFTSSAVVPLAIDGARLADGGATLAVQSKGETTWQILRLADGATLDTVDGYPVEDVAFAPGGRTAAVRTRGGVSLVDCATLRPVASLDIPATTLAWTP